MSKPPGAPPPSLTELVRAEDRISFIYFERAIIHRDQNAITATDAEGTVHVPAATIGVVMLGPGTRISHQAVALIANSGATIVWVGERGVRFYAFGRSLARSSRLLEAQARLFSNQSSRLAVARAMYGMRFPEDDVSHHTMQQLRGREGARVRNVYREHSKRTGVKWSGRQYDPDDFENSDPINIALSSAHQCLYGIVHAVIVSMGCVPGLGFVHVGNELSFVYDIADLYKAEITIPIAFDVVASQPNDVEAATRYAVRDAVVDMTLLSRCVRDIRTLLGIGNDPENGQLTNDFDGVNELWDGGNRTVSGGVSYSNEDNDSLPPGMDEW